MSDKSEQLTRYMNNQIQILVRQAVAGSWRNPRQMVFLLRALISQHLAGLRRSRQEKSGRHVPPLLIASITSRCNLFCKGCYARASQSCGENRPDGQLTPTRWGEIFYEADQLGVSFILLAGGEPLLNQSVLEQAAGRKRIIFPVFTNGVLIDDDYARLFDLHRHLIPVLSLEGNAEATDRRRGSGVQAMIETAMSRLQQRGIFFGASITITSENLKEATSSEFVGSLFRRGVHLLFFIEYVPVDPAESQAAPGDPERQYLARQLEVLRREFDKLLLISFPGDEQLTGGCVAAGRGFFHINCDGGAEPCPFSPFSDTSLMTASLTEALDSPLFKRLERAGFLLGEHTGGCHLFEHEKDVRALLDNARTSD